MNTVPYFLLGSPIAFKGICTIYPLSIGKRLSFDEQYLNTLFLPYVISEELIQEKYGTVDIFSCIVNDEVLLSSFCESLKVLCNAEKIQLDKSGCKILIDDNKTPMDSSAFKDFSKVVRDWNCISVSKPEPEPVFETEEGRRQWLNLKAMRAKNAKVENDFLSTMINVVQFGGASYISEDIILNWTVWKLASAYHAVINSREYEHSFSAYLQGGKRDLVKQHWTERLKPNLQLK